jgi:hypothetical protein
MKPVFRITEARDRKENTAVTSGFIGVRMMSLNLQALPKATACFYRANLRGAGPRIWR